MIKILEGNLAAYSGTKEESVTREQEQDQEQTDSPKVRASEELAKKSEKK